MAFEKLNFNISALQNFSDMPTSLEDYGLGNTSTQLLADIPTKANAMTTASNGISYLGMGVMVTLFFYLVFKLGDTLEMQNVPFSTIRTVGISGGVVGLFGLQMLSMGYFTEAYHVVIFLGLLLVAFLWVWFEDRK